MLVGLALIVGFILLWGVMLFRKAALVLIAVFAPIAFARSAWDPTRVWTRRWLEIVAALVFCKVVIIVVFVFGARDHAGVSASNPPVMRATVPRSCQPAVWAMAFSTIVMLAASSPLKRSPRGR
jgi:amino acid permease